MHRFRIVTLGDRAEKLAGVPCGRQGTTEATRAPTTWMPGRLEAAPAGPWYSRETRLPRGYSHVTFGELGQIFGCGVPLLGLPMRRPMNRFDTSIE